MNKPRHHLLLVAAALVSLTGCGLAPMDSAPADTADGRGDTAANDSDDLDTWFGSASVWGIDGELVLEDGEPSAGTSVLMLETRGVSCTVRVTLDTVQAVEPPPEPEGLLHLWQLDLTPDPEATCAWRGPTSIQLGLGPTDPQQQPAADRAGVNLGTSYGLYLGERDRPLFLVGAAGTDVQLSGAGEPSTTPPVPDGEYRLVTLHGIPLAP